MNDKTAENESMEKTTVNNIIKKLTKDYEYPEELIQTTFDKIEITDFSNNFNSIPHIVIWNNDHTHRLIVLTLDVEQFKFKKNYDKEYASIICTYDEEIKCWYNKSRIKNLISHSEIIDKSRKEINDILNKKLFESGFFNLPEIIFTIRDILRSRFHANEEIQILMEIFLIKIIDELEFKNKYFGYSDYKNNYNVDEIQEKTDVFKPITIQDTIKEILVNSKISKEFFRDFRIINPQNRYEVEQIFAILSGRSLLKSHTSSIENSFLDIFDQMSKAYIFSSRDVMKFVKHHTIIEKNKKILLDVDGHGLYSFFHILNEIREFCEYDDDKIREYVKSSLTVITRIRDTFDLVTFFKILNKFECKIECGDFKNIPLKEKYDIIFFNPPYGMRGHTKTKFGTDMGNDIIISMLKKLSKNGIAIFTTIGGFLFRSNGGYVETRKHIIENYKIKSIQLLPSGILPSTSVQPVLIKIKNDENNKKEPIFFTLIQSKIRGNEKIDLLILEKTFKKIKEFELTNKITIPTEFGFTTNVKEIIKNDYNFNPPRYFDLSSSLILKDDKQIKLSDVLEIIRGTLPRKNLTSDKPNLIIKYFEMIKILDIQNNIINENSLKKIPIYENDKLNQNSILQKNDIVFSISGKVGKNALISKSDDKKIISSQLVILRPDIGKIDPIYLQMCLNSDLFKEQIERFSTGSLVQRLSIIDLKNFWIPLKSLDKQKKVSHELHNLQKYISELKQKLDNAENQMKNIIYETESDKQLQEWKQVK